MVGNGIEPGGLNSRRVDINRIDRRCAPLGCRNGQNAGAATVIQHLAQDLLARDPAQAHPGGGMGARAKREAGVQPDDLPRLRGRLMPGGHNPERWRNFNRRKLRLGQAHPILVRQRADTQNLAARKKILRL